MVGGAMKAVKGCLQILVIVEYDIHLVIGLETSGIYGPTLNFTMLAQAYRIVREENVPLCP